MKRAVMLFIMVGILVASFYNVQADNIIVPGIRVGDFTFGMTKDDLLKKLGRPSSIFYGGKDYTLEDLPETYYMGFDDIAFLIRDGSVRGIGVDSPLYKFTNGLGVGSSEQRVVETFGKDFRLKEGGNKDFLIYEDEGLEFEISRTRRTVLEMSIQANQQEQSDEIGVSGTNPEQTVDLHEDLRGIVLEMKGKDLTQLDLSNIDLTKTTFDSFTQWPASERLPKDFDPDKVMEWGKYPGLGVKQLHDQGITGVGVHVAIIDQPLLPDHVEYRDQLASYTEIQTGDAGPQMHGPAVASLLVGKTCGVAPGAILHFWAQPSWKGDYQYRCIALEQIIQYNKGKERTEQIRILSVSKGISRGEPNVDRWKALLEEARQSGIYVFHCGDIMSGAGCPVFRNSDEPGNYKLCEFLDAKGFVSDEPSLYAPIDNRTTASSQEKDAYIFWSKGGFSWGAPYIAGVAALGVQANPDLTVEQIDQLLYESGWDFLEGKLINPVGFVHAVRNID